MSWLLIYLLPLPRGLLGLNFLRSFVLIINFPKGKLALLRANSNPLQRLRGFIELARVYW
jgi:hypothetical protein